MVLSEEINCCFANSHRFGCYQMMGDMSTGEVLVGHNERVSPPSGCRERREKLRELLAIPGLWGQTYAAFALSVAAFLAGVVEGWPGSISMTGLELLDGNGHLSRGGAHEVSMIFLFMILSAMIHMMITGALLDRFGRRVGCWFLNFLAPSGWVFLITVRSWQQLYVGAALIGTVGLSGENVGVVYLSEISNERLRGPLISLFMFFNSLGIFASHVWIAEVDFQSFHMFCLGVTLVFPFVFWRLPESPAYLMKKSRIEDARESVAWYHGNSPEVVESEMRKLKNATIINFDECKTLFGYQSNRRAMTIVVGLFILTELIGSSMVEVFAGGTLSMINYSSSIRTISAKTASLILATFRFFGGILNVYFVERSGRKSTLTLSLWIMALLMGVIFFFLIGTKVVYGSQSTNVSNHTAQMFIKASFYVSFVCFGLYTLTNQMFLGTTEVLSGELLTADTKGAVMALAGIARILTLVVCVVGYNFILNFDHLGTCSFFVYSSFCGLGAVVANRFIRETQGKTLNEIHSELDETGAVAGPA